MNHLTGQQGDYSRNGGILYLAFELGNKDWKLGFTVGFGQKPRERTIIARDLAAVRAEIDRAKERFGLAAESCVMSCYEAGRDGFWLHRYLEELGVMNLVVDSSSIEVNRRARRAKTDRMDVRKLLTMLIRYDNGDRRVWSVVRVPTVEQEDSRQLHRELKALKKERNRQVNRIKGLLASQGIGMSVRGDFLFRLDRLRVWDGSPLPWRLKSRLVREYERLGGVKEQIKEVERERAEIVKSSTEPDVQKVRQLMQLKGIGIDSAWPYVMELFGWRQFRNRRELGSLSGLTPTPHQSGEEARERGISKAGNCYIKSIAIELGWDWLRYQPQSKLSQWYKERFGHGSKRLRKIGIVALARKLIIELWRYLETGVIPEGAVLKAQR